jgi:predicted Zn finger-like uncharacterized protein
MAVELRCPDCRTKLRLQAAPDAGTEVECPKCGTVFPAPAPAPEPDDGDEPKKKKPPAEGGAKKGERDKPAKGTKAAADKPAAGKDAKPNAPKKRRAKKKETSKAALIGVISAGAVMLLSMAGVLIWYYTRTTKAVEMFYYVPEDAQSAYGINLGHAQKYPAFYKATATVQTGTDFKSAGDAVAKAAGTEMDGLMDYVVRAESVANGASIVFRTKAEFDDAALAKIPDAEKKSLDGTTYYLAAVLPKGEKARVFAPTKRLIVVCPESTNEAAFKKILSGHSGNRDKTLGVRMGDLGARVTRGTYWSLTLFDDAVKPPGAGEADPQPAGQPGAGGGAPAPKGGGSSAQDDKKLARAREVADALNGAKGWGVKASLGSREVRLEIDVWQKDGDKLSAYTKKMKESELGKADDGTPPRWFSEETQQLGDKKVAAQLLSNIGFGSSGALFYARTAVETTDIQQSATRVLNKVLGKQPQQGGGMPTGGPGGPGGKPPGGPPGGLPGAKQRRRYGPVRSCR